MAAQPTQTVKMSPAQAIEHARAHYGAGRLQPAAKVLDAVLKSQPGNADALNLAAATATGRARWTRRAARSRPVRIWR